MRTIVTARGLWLVAVVVLIATGAARIASTWRVFSQTVDEPIHVASGFQLLTTGRYDLDPEHPPLARAAFAIGAVLSGAKVDSAGDRIEQGRQILYRESRYRHNLAEARAGNLPFFVAAAIAVAIWSRRLFGSGTSLIAVALFTSLPPILGHAGLATTDFAVTAATTIALLVLWRWLAAPTWGNAVWLGLAISLGLLSKFSFPVFFACGAVVMAVTCAFLRDRSRHVPLGRIAGQAVVMSAIAIFSVWSCYRFAAGTFNTLSVTVFPPADPRNVAARYTAVPGYEWVRADLIERYWRYGEAVGRRGLPHVDFVDWAKAAGYPSPLAGRSGDTMRGAPPIPPPRLGDTLLEPIRWTAAWLRAHVPLPAPQFFAGMIYVARHSEIGHPSYFLGDYRDHGWWYYFPLLFLFKTPLPFTVLAIAGLVMLLRRGVREREGEAMAVAVAPLAFFIPAMASGINIGLRHILPVYPLLTIVAAFAASRLWSSANRLGRTAVVILLAWYFIGTAVAHPDYLAYFNELAGRRPDRIAVDSNLDWGQDLLRLSDVTRREHIERLHLAYFGSAVWTETATTVEPLDPYKCVSGWVAVSETILKQGGLDHRGHGFRWLDRFPSKEIGRSIRLYRVPDGACKSVTASGS